MTCFLILEQPCRVRCCIIDDLEIFREHSLLWMQRLAWRLAMVWFGAKKFVVCDVEQCWHTGTSTTRSPTLNWRTDSRTQGYSVKYFVGVWRSIKIAIRCTVSHCNSFLVQNVFDVEIFIIIQETKIVDFIFFGQNTHNGCHFQNNILHKKCWQLTIVNEIT